MSDSDSIYNLKLGFDEDDKQWYFGRVRTFFNTKFIYDEELEIYQNIMEDYEVIQTSFSKIRFKVDKPLINLTAAEMINKFKDKDIEYFGCVVIFVFSHGEQDYIFGSDYNSENQTGKINVWNNYYHYFSEDYRPKMVDCPKVFFNEWCQGDATNNVANTDGMRIVATRFNTSHWLIFNAAMPRYDVFVGSLSTRCFCQFLEESANKTKDLFEILTMVRKNVGKIEINPFEYLHPMISSTLENKLCLPQED